MSEKLLPEQNQKQVWKSLSRALGAELRDHNSVTGLSGIDHPVDAIAVDEPGKRIILFSAEPNPKTAALVRTDVQSAIPDKRILFARPIAFDGPAIAREFVKRTGGVEILLPTARGKPTTKRQKKANEEVAQILFGGLEPFLKVFTKLPLPAMNQILAAIQQCAYLDLSAIRQHMHNSTESFAIPLLNMLSMDGLAMDREYGICPVPLYEFSEDDWESLLSGRTEGDIQERLKRMGILQYFFPPPDQLALGLIDREIGAIDAVVRGVTLAPEIGHPYGQYELTNVIKNPLDLIEELKDKGLVVDGEFGLESTESGHNIRATVKFRPREGLLSRLSKIVSLKLDFNLKDLAGK